MRIDIGVIAITIIRDIQKTIGGLINLIRYPLLRDDQTVRLSLFTSESLSIKKDGPSTYEVVLTNNTHKSLWVKLLIDIYSKDNPVHPEGHHAYFERRIFLEQKKAEKIIISYDWKKEMSFKIRGVLFAPEGHWYGNCDLKGKFLMHAVLVGKEGKHIDMLTIVQEAV